jgi:hypothetical protein
MMRRLAAGAVAGSAGTMALNVVTYLDMLVRARPASGVPSTTASRLADAAGIRLGDGSTAGNRASALGGLLGNIAGLSVAVGYGLLRRFVRRPPLLPAAVALGAAAMAASDTPAARTGATDPRTWGASGWLSDIVPHLVYGLATVASYEAVVGDRP